MANRSKGVQEGVRFKDLLMAIPTSHAPLGGVLIELTLYVDFYFPNDNTHTNTHTHTLEVKFASFI